MTLSGYQKDNRESCRLKNTLNIRNVNEYLSITVERRLKDFLQAKYSILFLYSFFGL